MKPVRHVEHVVVGAGVVGSCVAYELVRRGAEVLVLDAGDDVGAGCSWANAGLLSPTHVEPLTTPTNIALGLRYLWRTDSPFHVRPHLRMVPWLLRFAASSGPRRAAALTARMQELARASLSLHHDYVDRGVQTGLRSSGALDVYLSQRTYDRALHAPNSLGHQVLDATQTRALEPALGPVAGSTLHTDDAMLESRTFVRAVLTAATPHGADVWWSTPVRALGAHKRGALLDLGDRVVTCGQVTLAAGMGTVRLAASCGVQVPLQPGIGYVVDVPPASGPTRPVTFKELKVVATPYEDRLRLSGTMDLGAAPNRINPKRVQAMTAAAARGLPHVPTASPLQVWTGQRPCTPDGVPMLGRSDRAPELVLATGHGMWGLMLAPISGRIVAEDATDGGPRTQDADFSSDRFTATRGSRWLVSNGGLRVDPRILWLQRHGGWPSGDGAVTDG